MSEDAAEEAAELKEVEEMDAVNEESKATLANALAGKMAAHWVASATTLDSFVYLFAIHAAEEKGVGSKKTQ